MSNPRLLFIHKQSTSGRVRFLRFPESVLSLLPLPPSATLREEGYSGAVAPDHGALGRAAEEKLGLPAGSIKVETEFQVWADTPGGDVPLVLAGFTTIDPPFEAVDRLDGRFIAITEARRLPEVEQQLLRRAYEYVLG